jgi:hypothetical protein
MRQNDFIAAKVAISIDYINAVIAKLLLKNNRLQKPLTLPLPK